MNDTQTQGLALTADLLLRQAQQERMSITLTETQLPGGIISRSIQLTPAPQPVPVPQQEPKEEKCSAPQCAANRNAKITYCEGGGSSRKMGSDGYYKLNYLAK